MKIEELNYFCNNWGTRSFNIHTEREYPLVYDYSQFKHLIYIENDRILSKKVFDHNQDILQNYPIGCNHISAIRKETRIDQKGYACYDTRTTQD